MFLRTSPALIAGAAVFLFASSAQPKSPTPENDGGSGGASLAPGTKPLQVSSELALVPPPRPPEFDAELATTFSTQKLGLNLVGLSGQLYRPTGPESWERTEAGGISASIQAVFVGAGLKLFAVGSRAPLFARSETHLWAAYPLMKRGSAAANSGALAIISLRRHIYELSAQGWRRIATAPVLIDTLWAASNKRFTLSDKRGQLWIGANGVWKKVAIALHPEEVVARIAGVSGGLAVALTSEGRLFLIREAAEATLIVSKALGEGLKIDTIAAVRGVLLAAGHTPKRNLLIRVGGRGALAVESELWPLVEGDRFSILASLGDELLVASSRGQIRIREKDRKTWRRGRLAAAPSALKSFEHAGPALAR